MKKIAIYSSFVLLIFGTACKKDKLELPETNSVSLGGQLLINQYLLVEDDTIQDKHDIHALAHFTGPNVIDYLSVDSVLMNGTTLSENSGFPAGYYTAPVKPATAWIWRVEGNNGIPDFDYTNTTVLPSYTEFASLPDVIDRSKDFVISLKGLKNASSASIQINGGPNAVFKTFTFLPGASSIQIPASELIGLTQTDALVEISFENENEHQLNDRIFLFQNSISIGKRMKIN